MNSLIAPFQNAVAHCRRSAALAGSALALAAVGAPVAWAQDSRSQIEEVVVIAEKRTENLQEVPTAVSAFSQDFLEDIGSYEFKEAANFVPNVTIREQPGSNVNYAFGIRGVAAGETALAVDNPIGLYVDGVYLGRLTGTAIDNIEVERMEVLRGPQGTLYGRNSVGGAINLISRKPSGEFGFRNRLTLGSDQIRNQLRVDFGLSEGLAAQVNLLYSSQDANLDIYDRYGPQPAAIADTAASDNAQNAAFETETNAKDQTGFRLALNWDASDSFSADFNISYSKAEGLSDRQQLVSVPGGGAAAGVPANLYPVFSSLAPFGAQERQDGITNLAFTAEESTEITGVSLSLDWEMGNGMRLKSITAYRGYEGLKGSPDVDPSFGIDFGSARAAAFPGMAYGYAAPSATTGATPFIELATGASRGVVVDPQDLLGGGWTTVLNPVPEGTLVSVFRSGREGEQSQISQEFQLSGDIGERADFVAGLYYFAEETDERGAQFSLSPGLFYAGIVGAGLGTLGPAVASGELLRVEGGGGNVAPAGAGACGGSLGDDQASVGAALADFANQLQPKYLYPCYNSSVVGGNPGFAYGTDNTALAVYGHVRYQLSEQLDLGVGLRYTQDTREGYLHTAANANTDSQGNRLGDRERLTGEDDYDKLDFSVSLAFQPSEDLNVYGKVASGYRSGGFNVRASSADDFNNPVEAENLLSYELGVKSEFLDGRGRANVAAFYSEYTDRQISQFSAGIYGATSIISNAGEVSNTGFEVELTLLPVDGLTWNLNLGVVDVSIDKWNEDVGASGLACGGTMIAGGTANADVTACRWPAYSPEFNWSTVLRYDFEPFAMGQLSVVLDANYQDGYTFTSGQDPDVSVTAVGDERTLVGARVSMSDIALGPGKATVSLWGENILDEEYKEFPIDFGAFAVATYGAEPSFGLDLQYEF